MVVSREKAVSFIALKIDQFLKAIISLTGNKYLFCSYPCLEIFTDGN